jgi:PAS domain S-box-containing protein
MMERVRDFILLLLAQFAGGPGPAENNLVRFGLPAILWAVLFFIAWNRQRSQDLPREKLLMWGFGLALVRELYMFGQISYRLLGSNDAEAKCSVIQPLEHGLAMAAMIVVAGAFLLYILKDQDLSKRYLQFGISITLLVFVLTSLTWPRQLAAYPQLKFHQTWAAWLFHVPLVILLGIAIFLLWGKRDWLRNVVAIALTLYLISELLLLLNYATDVAYNTIICPIGNSLHILAIPVLGYIYLHEQSLEKKKAEDSLMAYRDHLEELVSARTSELTAVNTQLKQEVSDRIQAEQALEHLTRRYELILESTGEGICGINRQGNLTFANVAAARMLGYPTAELINHPGYSIWHRAQSEGTPHALEDCPIFQGHTRGIHNHGDDERFCRKDGSSFPIRYFTSPVWENQELAGSVLIFQDITERKRHEAEIAQRNASLTIRNAVAATLSQSLDVQENLNQVLQLLQDEMEMEFGLIFLRSGEKGDLVPYISKGFLSQEEIQAFSANSCNCQLINALAGKRAVTANLAAASNKEHPLCSDHPNIRSLIKVPLVSKDKAIGLLLLASRQTAVIQSDQLERLTAIGFQIGMAIENARLYQDAENRSEELSRLQEASSHLITAFDLYEVTAEIARQSAWLLRSQKAAVIHLDRQNRQFSLAASFGLSQDENQILRVELPGWAFLAAPDTQTGTIAIQDTSVDYRLTDGARERLGLSAILITPIWISEKPLDFIIVMETNSSRRWHEQEIELIESLANRAAVALMNVDLHLHREMAVALEERQRIAANMHDGLAQTLSLLGIRVDRIHELIEGDSDPETEDALREIREVVTRASTEVRHSIASLQEAPPPPSPLQDQIQELLGNYRIEGGPQLLFDSGPVQPVYIPCDQMDQVLPVVNEALLNATRHAQAQTISIRLEIVQENACITVEDDGIGFNLDCIDLNGDHFGLSVMQARAARIGGQLQIRTSPGKGTGLSLTWRLDSSVTHNHNESARIFTGGAEIDIKRVEQ